MKILIYSSVFYPSIGGIETITATLAENIQRLGHSCTVLTEEKLNGQDELDVLYKIIRHPTLKERFNIAKQCDLVHSNGASVAMYPFARLAQKPFIWTHNGYQVTCVDGLGWFEDEPAPMIPMDSLFFHLKKKGFSHFCKETLKLAVRQLVANQVDLNIAATQWVAKRQPLKNQVVAYTPYPLQRFKAARGNIPKKYDFIFVGRLVSEKGIETLLHALSEIVSEPQHRQRTLAIVGEGVKRQELEGLTTSLRLQHNVYFLGSKRNQDLIEAIEQAEIGVIPSIWEEPMGGVSLELLAAGKKVIVSEQGGHAECVGGAGLTFKNGDSHSLCQQMKTLLDDQNKARILKECTSERVESFDEMTLTQNYTEIYRSVLEEFN